MQGRVRTFKMFGVRVPLGASQKENRRTGTRMSPVLEAWFKDHHSRSSIAFAFLRHGSRDLVGLPINMMNTEEDRPQMILWLCSSRSVLVVGPVPLGRTSH